MTIEEYEKLPDEEKEMLKIGAKALNRITNEMIKCELGEDESALVFTCKDSEGEEYYFNLSGYVKNSPEKHDV